MSLTLTDHTQEPEVKTKKKGGPVAEGLWEPGAVPVPTRHVVPAPNFHSMTAAIGVAIAVSVLHWGCCCCLGPPVALPSDKPQALWQLQPEKGGISCSGGVLHSRGTVVNKALNS